MNAWERIYKAKPSEFFDIAAQQGYYGLERGDLTGEKDHVRKYREGLAIKFTVRSSIEKLINKQDSVSIIEPDYFDCT